MSRHDDALPAEFAALNGKVAYVQRQSATEWSSTCPKCTDLGHHGTEKPDRFRMFLRGKILGWCRRCGYLWFPDSDPNYVPPTPAEQAAFRKEMIEREEALKRSAERALSHLRDDQLWLKYHEQLDEAGRRYWSRRGIPEHWQDFWQLGWNPNSWWGCPTATIPIFAHQWQPLNIKHRLINYNDQGKYRYEIAGQGQPLFLCNPNDPVAGHVYAVEGEVKSMVCLATLDDADVCMVGLPGTNPSPAIVAQLAGDTVERVTLVMDPGAEQAAHDLALRIGQRKVRVLIPPAKIDDAIIACGADSYDVQRWLRQARSL